MPNGLCLGCRITMDDFDNINATCNHEKGEPMPNLDNSYAELVKAMTPMDETTFKDRLLENDALFGYFCRKYLDAPGAVDSFLDWAWEQYQREVTPKYTEGWRPETAQPDFAESYHDHLRRMAGEDPNDDR